MAGRSYNQFCAGARALDVIGDRWSLLIVRDLLLGQKRFTDLSRSLSGIAPNILSARLKELQHAGVITHTQLPPPAPATVYELTEFGRGLEPVLIELVRWGLSLMDSPRPGERVDVAWVLAAIRAMARPDAAAGITETYEFRLDIGTFHARLDDGKLELEQGAASHADVTIEMDVATFMAIGLRRIEAARAIDEGLIEVDGDPAAALRSVEVLGPVAPALVVAST